MEYVVDELPASRAAMLYRCFAHGTGALKSGTFQEDDLAKEVFGGGA